jgi:hypothetical protein
MAHDRTTATAVALPARLQQATSCATLRFVRLLRWGELVRWYARAGKQ